MRRVCRLQGLVVNLWRPGQSDVYRDAYLLAAAECEDRSIYAAEVLGSVMPRADLGCVSAAVVLDHWSPWPLCVQTAVWVVSVEEFLISVSAALEIPIYRD